MKIPFPPLSVSAALVLLSACGYPPPPCPPEWGHDTVSVVSQDWHSDVAIPVSELDSGLEAIAAQFPDAKTLLFGYGRESFMTAPPGAFSKYITAPLPGDGAIEVQALTSNIASAYPAEDVVTLALPPEGAHELSLFIRSDLADDSDGEPKLVAEWNNPQTYVYAANSRYNFLHTCNGWAAEALWHAGVPLSPSRVVTSERLMERAEGAKAFCMASGLHPR